jgi:cellulose synthase/poly-beta-1,6-N-acetylglucosamine synthase-like glycosyltransferase
VEACLAQDYPDVEVVVVDDGSTDDTERTVRQYPLRYLCQDNAGPASARNRGWHTATGEIVCFTDSDCVPARDWVSRLVQEYVSDQIAGVGGTYDIANANSLLAICIHEEIVQRHLRMPRDVNYLGAFNVSYRRAVLEEVGGFDESYGMASGEDNDLAYSVVKRGYSLVFTRDARVAHYHPDDLLRYLRRQFWHGYWRMKVYHNHPHMAGGDCYGNLLDFVQPPLSLASLVILPLVFVSPIVACLMSIVLITEMALQFPMAMAIVKRTRQIKHVALVPSTFLRGYMRGLGMILGIRQFLIGCG